MRVFALCLNRNRDLIFEIEQHRLFSDRFELVCFSKEQFILLLKNLHTFEKKVNYRYSDRSMKKEFLKSLRVWVRKDKEKLTNSNNMYWLAIRRDNRDIVGFFPFEMGKRNGCYIDVSNVLKRPYRDTGYISEIVKALTQWMLLHGNIYEIPIAEGTKFKKSSNSLRQVGAIRYRKRRMSKDKPAVKYQFTYSGIGKE